MSFTNFNLDSMTSAQREAFEHAELDQPKVLDCFDVAGSNDCQRRFAYRDAEDLERFHADVPMRTR